jgi:4-hydroxy-tetrahydrodipicolinate synthase
VDEVNGMDLGRLHGIVPPLVTPLGEDERIDHESLARLVDYVIDAGVHGVWAMGTTGEFAGFDADEREAAIRTTVRATRERVPVVACIGDASALLAVEHGRRAVRAGADFLAVTAPYYFANSQDELETHFRAVGRAVERPLLLYHIPQTVKVKVDPAVVRRLAADGVIVGLKDSQNDLEWYRRVLVDARADGVDLRSFLGTLSLIDLGVYMGGHGAIPGAANVAPELCVSIYEAARRGDIARAAARQERLMETSRLSSVVRGAVQVGSSIAAMKAELVRRGIIATGLCRTAFRACTPDEARAAAEILTPIEGAMV